MEPQCPHPHNEAPSPRSSLFPGTIQINEVTLQNEPSAAQGWFFWLWQDVWWGPGANSASLLPSMAPHLLPDSRETSASDGAEPALALSRADAAAGASPRLQAAISPAERNTLPGCRSSEVQEGPVTSPKSPILQWSVPTPIPGLCQSRIPTNHQPRLRGLWHSHSPRAWAPPPASRHQERESVWGPWSDDTPGPAVMRWRHPPPTNLLFEENQESRPSCLAVSGFTRRKISRCQAHLPQTVPHSHVCCQQQELGLVLRGCQEWLEQDCSSSFS